MALPGSSMPQQLFNKVAIITGVGSGIGQATAVMFASRGAKIALCDLDQERLETTLDQCVQASGGQSDRFIIIQGDVTDASVRANIVGKTTDFFGCVDILVPCVGILQPKMTIREATEENFDNIFNTNVKSPFFLIQQCLPQLEKSEGCIVIISSCLSHMVSQYGLYPMSKACLDHMTRYLAFTLASERIRVNAVNPAFLSTRILSNGDFPPDMNIEERNAILESIEQDKQPMGKLGSVEDVANAIAFLCCVESQFITGQCLLVDGGRQFTLGK